MEKSVTVRMSFQLLQNHFYYSYFFGLRCAPPWKSIQFIIKHAIGRNVKNKLGVAKCCAKI